MAQANQRKSGKRSFNYIKNAEYAGTVKSEELKLLKNAKNKATTAKMHARHEAVLTNQPELERNAFSKDLTVSPNEHDRYSLRSTSTDSLNSTFNRLSARLKGGVNSPGDRRAMNIATSPGECKSNPRGMQYLKPNTNVNFVEMKLNLTHDMESSPSQRFAYCRFFEEPREKKVKTRGTQSMYRESSAQTLPFLPEVSNKQADLEQMELFKLPTILPGDGPPGLYQVEVLDRARKRWAFAQALKENFRRQIEEAKAQAKLSQQDIVLQAFEWEHWIEREEYIQECQMLRLEILIGMFNKREEKIHVMSKARIERSYEVILAQRETLLDKNRVEYERGMRQLEIKRRRVPKCWRKENIVSQLGSPSSEFYGPQLRYGVNPARRHFVGGRKEFEARMDDLEKRAVKFTKLVCPFAKLKKWAKPKQRFLEIEQNFCSDENLQKMYETLTSLRKQAVKQKVVPKCLIQKTKQAVTPKTTPRRQEDKVDILVEEDPVETEEVIRERRASEGELKRLEDLKFRRSIGLKKQRAQYLMQELYDEELEAMVQEYEGCTIGWIMRFLSEEMGRLQEQRLLHYITMMAQKERWRREAAEAGLRQKENNMREIYEQIYNDTMEGVLVGRKYLNMILDEDISKIAHQKAETETLDLAHVIDADVQRWLDSLYRIQNPLNYQSLRYKLRKIMFPDLDEILKQLEIKQMLHYIIEDVLFNKVFNALEPYDICTALTGEIIDRLLDLDLYYFSSEVDSTCSCLACNCADNDREVRALIRKLIRHVVPGRRWKTPHERMVKEILADLVNDVVKVTNSRGSVFESDSMNRFCQLQLYTSHTNLLYPSTHSLESYFTSSKSHSSSSDILGDFLTNLLPGEYENEEPMTDRRTEASSSVLKYMPQAFYLDLSERDESEEDKLSLKTLNKIYKELLNFLGSETDSDDKEEDEDQLTTSRSSQSSATSACGLRSVIDEIFRRISAHEASPIIPETTVQTQLTSVEDEIAEIYAKSQPLELISHRSSEGQSEQPVDVYIEQQAGQDLPTSAALEVVHPTEEATIEGEQEPVVHSEQAIKEPLEELQSPEKLTLERGSDFKKHASLPTPHEEGEKSVEDHQLSERHSSLKGIEFGKKSSLRSQLDTAGQHVRISVMPESTTSHKKVSIENRAETADSDAKTKNEE